MLPSTYYVYGSYFPSSRVSTFGHQPLATRQWQRGPGAYGALACAAAGTLSSSHDATGSSPATNQAAGLREAQGLTLGPTVVSRSRAAQSLARGLAQKPVGSALRCGRRFSGLLCPREEVCGQCPAHSTWVLALSADCESPCAGLPLTSSLYKCANQ